MRIAILTRSMLAAGLAGALTPAGAFLVFAGHETSVASYTGCLNVESGTLVGLAAGSNPLMSCRLNQIQVHLSGGDLTSVRPGAGLEGGSTNGAAILGLKPPYQLPQGCLPGAVAEWTGTEWECGTDLGSATSAIGGVSEQGVLGDGIPDSFATVGQMRLPPGKYAIFAKIQIDGSADEMDSDTEYAYCQLTADSHFDSGLIYTRDGGDHINGVISLMLLHEFEGEGVVDVSCADHGDDPDHDYADSRWSDLRITAITLDWFAEVPLTR